MSLLDELNPSCPRGCGRTMDDCHGQEDGGQCAGGELLHEKEKLERGFARLLSDYDRRGTELADAKGNAARFKNQLKHRQDDYRRTLHDVMECAATVIAERDTELAEARRERDEARAELAKVAKLADQAISLLPRAVPSISESPSSSDGAGQADEAVSAQLCPNVSFYGRRCTVPPHGWWQSCVFAEDDELGGFDLEDGSTLRDLLEAMTAGGRIAVSAGMRWAEYRLIRDASQIESDLGGTHILTRDRQHAVTAAQEEHHQVMRYLEENADALETAASVSASADEAVSS